MRIGIFEGKKAHYNKKILKFLIEKEPLKAWDIAKLIAKGSMEKTQDVYAALIRKNGRLNELQEKQYIKLLPNKRYIPTFKGIIAYAFQEKHARISRHYNDIFSEAFSYLPKQMIIPLFNLKVDIDFFKEQIKNIEFTEEELRQLKNFIEESMPWIDLDRMREEEILTLTLLRLMLKDERIIEELKAMIQKFFKL